MAFLEREIMDLHEIIEDLKDIQKHPSSYILGDPDFLVTANFLTGYFWGRVNMWNFREWLVLKTGYHHDNAWWTDLVLLLAFPGRNVFINSVPDEDFARNFLLDLVIEYIRERDVKGEDCIHQEYLKIQEKYRLEHRIDSKWFNK
ncbi:MAG: hypothetical protein Q4A17_14950 [Thermoguttaceae bacterium]|nr:hypothetical protein [Thermoguttaceae bacterium]MDO4859229.1 hypothetical protein [Thermoguttaceae bacterium]